MQKQNINFRQMKKKVTYYEQNHTPQTTYYNPASKVSFRGIRRNKQNNLTQQLTQQKFNNSNQYYFSPIKIDPVPSKDMNQNRQQCNKFSTLISSKGYSSCNSERKNTMQLSFRGIIDSSSSYNTIKNRINTQRTQKVILNKQKLIQQKCRKIKQKQYFAGNENNGELSSLYKLKNKIISPFKQKTDYLGNQEKNLTIYQHSSILSQHDLVNTSKSNQSLDFNMSPYI